MQKSCLRLQEGKEGAEKTGEAKSKKEGELSGEESTRSTSRTREKSHKSDKVQIQIDYCKSHYIYMLQTNKLVIVNM